MRFSELKQRPKEELGRMIQDNRERLRQLKFDLASGKVKNVREIRAVRKDISRIITILKEKNYYGRK